MQHIKLLTLLALLGHLSLDPWSPSSSSSSSPAVASAANNRRFIDYSDPAARAPQDAAASDPSAWIRSGSAQDLASRRRGASLLPGFPAAGSGADPFSTWNQYMYEMVRNMIPGAGGLDASAWFGGGQDEDDVGTRADGAKSSIMRLPPGVYARETEAERLYFMDLPGFHRSEVAVEVVAGHLLSVRAERKCDPADAYCTSRAIKHKLELDPDTIDTRKISVNLDAGELRIHLPKRSATRFSIPVIDSLFGLNQPGASDKAGAKVKIAKIPDDKPDANANAGAIHWPGMPEAPGIVDAVKDWYGVAKDTAGNVVESAESVAQRAKQAAFGGATGQAAQDGGRAAQDAANYARRAVHHTTDSAQDALGRTADQARDSVQQARDKAYGTAQDAANQARGVAQDAASQARGSAQHVANQVRGTAEQAQAQVRDASNYATNAAQQARDTVYGKAQDAAEAVYGAYGSAADSLNQAAGAASDASARAAQAAADSAAKARDAAKDTAANAYDSAAAGVHQARRAAGDAAGTVQDTAADAAGKAAQAASDAAGTVQAKAGDAVDAAKGTAESIKLAVERNLVEPVESAAEAAARKAGEAVDATKHMAGEVADEAKHKAGSWFGFFQDVGAGAKEAAVEGSEGAKEGWEKGTTESRIKRQAGH